MADKNSLFRKSALDKLASLKVLVEGGRLTAGVSSSISDAASALLIASDLERGVGPELVSARFHAGFAAATVEAASRAAERNGLDAVALSGGVFQNRLLLEAVASGLTGRGLRPLIPLQLPAGDGCISYGQAAVASAQSLTGPSVESVPG